jgi:Ser/Thr protein kinase RdoA (MazF antagonist)
VLPAALHELAYRGWRTHPLHGDYAAPNLRVQDDRVIGVFDWDETRLDWRACELADAVWAFSRHVANDGFDRESAQDFLDAYQSAGGEVTPGERAELVLLMRARRLWEALFFLGAWQRGDEISWDYLAENVRALDALDGVEGL